MSPVGFPMLTREEVRAIDAAAIEELKIPGLLLMENAARGIVEVLQQFRFDRCVILCGRGNNGGDGLAVARLLAAVGQSAEVFLLPGERPLSSDAAANRNFLERGGMDVLDLDSTFDFSRLGASVVVVDCLLGTGFQGTLRSHLREVTAAVNASDALVLSVDVPSGLDCQTGRVSADGIKAHTTVTFVGQKVGFAKKSAREFLGEVVVKPIGVPMDWVNDWLQRYRA